MILICPNCQTNYFANDETIGESGRTVKCAACDHSWFAQPQPEAPVTDAADSPPPPHEVYRERVKEQRRQRSRFAALLSWLVTASVFFGLGLAALILRNDVVKLWPQSASAYKWVGFDVNRYGLEFSDIQRSRTFNGTVPVVTLTGNAQNVANSEIETPNVEVLLIDEAGNTLSRHVTGILPPTLQKEEAGRFELKIEPAPIEGFEVKVSFVDDGETPVTPPPAEAEPIPEDLGVGAPESISDDVVIDDPESGSEE